jgi:hypothetical protein
MDFYKALETVRLPGGTVLELTPEQARRRRHLLDINEDDDLVARQSVEFKAAEVIGLEQVPLVLKAALEPVDLAMLKEDELPSGDLEDLGEGDLLTIDDSIDSANAGEKIVPTLEERPDNAEPGEQIRPESGDLAPVPAARRGTKPKDKGTGK